MWSYKSFRWFLGDCSEWTTNCCRSHIKAVTDKCEDYGQTAKVGPLPFWTANINQVSAWSMPTNRRPPSQLRRPVRDARWRHTGSRSGGRAPTLDRHADRRCSRRHEVVIQEAIRAVYDPAYKSLTIRSMPLITVAGIAEWRFSSPYKWRIVKRFWLYTGCIV